MNLKISIIIPVFNESLIISQTIRHLQTLESKKADEIIVVDGDPLHTTISTISDQTVKKTSSRKGRGAQMNHGAKMATGDILLFLHADTRLVSDALSRIENALNSADVIGGAFNLGIRSDGLSFRIIEKMASLRSRITRIPYGDQAIFIKRDFFNNMGGYREIPIMEDVDLMKRVKSLGGKIKILNQTVQTSPRRWESEGILYCTLRNWMVLALYKCGIAPNRLARFYK